MRRVLFVGTGNICRSPIAERLAAAWAAERGLELRASSAGTRGVADAPMDETAALVLEGFGGDPGGFRARRLQSAHLQDTDLILTMTTRHRVQVLELDPATSDRTFTLLGAAGLLLGSDQPDSRGLAEQLTELRARPSSSDPDTGPADPTDQDIEDQDIEDQDIEDPFRRGDQSYELAGGLIADALLVVLPRLFS